MDTFKWKSLKIFKFQYKILQSITLPLIIVNLLSIVNKLIYKDIFEWYDDKVHSGDTLITYRTAIFRKYYGKSYSKLSRDKQREILNIIKSYTEYDDDFPFEFELDNKEKNVYQICNNYQIGNFGIFPKGRINPKRAQSPYNDYAIHYIE
ncbi:Uncharacterised protein [Streptococcus pneumoniae]|nr:Uncharacterised protein [Streptococcus pneumoniae]